MKKTIHESHELNQCVKIENVNPVVNSIVSRWFRVCVRGSYLVPLAN
jgi:hypothetical protein